MNQSIFIKITILSLGLLFFLGIGCKDKLRDEVTIEGTVTAQIGAQPLEGMAISYLQTNGKEFPKIKTQGTSLVTGVDGKYSYTYNPFKDKSSGDLQILAQIGTINPSSSGPRGSEFFFSVAKLNIPAAELIENEEAVLTKDLIAKPFGYLFLEVKSTRSTIDFDRLYLTVKGEEYDHTLELDGNQFNGKFLFPVLGSDNAQITWRSVVGGVEETGNHILLTPTAGDEFTYKIDL